MSKRALGFGALLGAFLLVGACEHPLGAEHALFAEIELVVQNDSDEIIYLAVAGAGPSDIVKGVLKAALSGESTTLGLGGQRLDTIPGGCLDDEQVWIFRNLSDTPIRQGDLPGRMDDIQIVHHIPDGTCFEQDTVEFHWPEATR